MINYNDIIDTYINETLKYGDVSSGIFLLNIDTLPQDNESIKLNGMNISVYNDDVNSNYCYKNGFLVYEWNNHHFTDYTKKEG